MQGILNVDMSDKTHRAESLSARPAQPAAAIASVILSMALVAVGNGLMFAFIPVRLAAEGYAPTWAGSILTGLSAGGIAGCLLTGALVRRVGHARAYMIFTALIVLSNTMVGVVADPVVWLVSRVLYGFGICALFIVSQSWLNDVVSNAIRGRVMAIFYVSYIVGLGVGYFLLAFVDVSGAQAPLVCILFAALSILPVGMTRLSQPPPPQAASVALARAWRISPVGLAGMLAVGGLSMLISGFAPIHATAKGYTQQEVATLMSLMPLGTLLLQIPLGWVSDRTDRRYVLATAALTVCLVGIAAARLDTATLAVVVVVYMVWAGMSESIYSLSSAHASDRANKDDLVALSSSMLLAWSVSGFIIPASVTALTGFYGTQSFIYVVIGIAAAYFVFVVARIVQRRPAASPSTFTPMTAQVPPQVDLAFGSGERREAKSAAQEPARSGQSPA